MTDTAEYWFDKNTRRSFNTFRHGKGIKCGHNHNVKDTIYVDDVECRACQRMIKEGQVLGMVEGRAPEGYYMSKREKKSCNAKKAFIEKYGKCPCGCGWAIRTNGATGDKFLGCSNFPKCRGTKSIAE